MGLAVSRQNRAGANHSAHHVQDGTAKLAVAARERLSLRHRRSALLMFWGRIVLELIIISTLNGILFGMLLFLMASGLTVIFSMLGVLNFAHASFYMLGAFFGFQ